VVARFEVSDTGTFALKNYFEPYDYINLDKLDLDIGTGGVSLLDPTVFKGTGVSRIGVVAGKNSKMYILNANNLGGFKQGSGGTDKVLQTISVGAPVWSGTGSYPLEGGYI
jgi:iron transport multicopper oxidase